MFECGLVQNVLAIRLIGPDVMYHCCPWHYFMWSSFCFNIISSQWICKIRLRKLKRDMLFFSILYGTSNFYLFKCSVWSFCFLSSNTGGLIKEKRTLSILSHAIWRPILFSFMLSFKGRAREVSHWRSSQEIYDKWEQDGKRHQTRHYYY